MCNDGGVWHRGISSGFGYTLRSIHFVLFVECVGHNEKTEYRQLYPLSATVRIHHDSNYASLTRWAVIISDRCRCLNHSMCWTAAHHPKRRRIMVSADLPFSVVHPWLSRSIPLRLTTHTHTLSTAHATAVGSGWCTFIRWSRVPGRCQETDTEAKTKLWVHYGCVPCCLNISLSVYTEPFKKAGETPEPVCKLHGNLASVQL